jgi:hypothetical protein
MSSEIKKNIILVSLLALLSAPLLQKYIFCFNQKPLLGALIPAQDTVITLNGWFSAQYQTIRENYLNENFGFREFFVRLNNQKNFSLFKKTSAFSVIIGKNDVLYQNNYYDSYIGADYAGEDYILDEVQKFKFVQDYLLKYNKYLLFIIAPGKVSFFPEYLPDDLPLTPVNPSNYNIAIRVLNNNKVNFIDFRNYFLKIKDQSPYPLFPKCGTHWSGYAATIVMDSIIRYFESWSKVDMTDFQVKPGIVTDKNLRWTDEDIGGTMNLLVPLSNWKTAYPEIIFCNQPEKVKPNLLLIGDSFSQSLFKFYPYFENLLGTESVYWYYNNIVAWPDSIGEKYIAVKSLDLYNEVMKRDYVLIVSTDENLKTFSFGFADECYRIFSLGDTASYRSKIAMYEQMIRTNPDWMKTTEKQSQERNITVDEMVHLNAIWYLNNEKTQKVN